MFGIRVFDHGATVLGPHDVAPAEGAWLESYNPDAHEGYGYAAWTLNPAKAMQFATHNAAVECWRMPSVVRPVREDGRPNRPLTAFSVSIEELP